MAGKKGKSGGDRRSRKAQGLPETLPALPETKSAYERLIRVLNANPVADEQTKDPEASGWRILWDSPVPAVRLNVRKFLYTMRDGKPAQNVEVSGKGGGSVPVQIITTAELPEA